MRIFRLLADQSLTPRNGRRATFVGLRRRGLARFVRAHNSRFQRRGSSMQKLDLNLLALIVGLSVYVASIRFVVIGRLLASPPPSIERKNKYHTFLKFLIPADASFVSAGGLLFLNIYWENLFCGSAPNWFPLAIVWVFFLGIIYLVGHHIVSWVKEFSQHGKLVSVPPGHSDDSSPKPQMVIVLVHWLIKQGHETEFESRWREMKVDPGSGLLREILTTIDKSSEDPKFHTFGIGDPFYTTYINIGIWKSVDQFNTAIEKYIPHVVALEEAGKRKYTISLEAFEFKLRERAILKVISDRGGELPKAELED